MSSTGVGSASFEVQVTQGIVSSGFPAKMNAAWDFPVLVNYLTRVFFRRFRGVSDNFVLFVQLRFQGRGVRDLIREENLARASCRFVRPYDVTYRRFTSGAR